ncbi:hypothetical protein ACJRO7_025114 [Eucalyptus globulus]|uniref:Uncharacterized protein n=1 Tax=Eucalyptus globulus TaxID=34317 RepID=A0ABD3KK28_EUCGL
MAHLIKAQILLLLLVTLLVVSSEARYPLMLSTTEKKIDVQEDWFKLGYSVFKLEYVKRRMGAELQKASPGGPDPQHH